MTRRRYIAAAAGGGGGVLLISHTTAAGTSTFTSPSIDSSGANLLVVAVSHITSASPTLSDNKGNTWSPLTDKADGSQASVRLYYCASPTVGTGHTFTLTGTSMFAALDVAAFSGLLASPFQVENSALTASATALQPGSVTPATGGALVVTAHCWESNTNAASQSINSGFTILDSSDFSGGTNFGGAMAYFIQPTAAAVNPTWSWTGADASAAVIAVFKHV